MRFDSFVGQLNEFAEAAHRTRLQEGLHCVAFAIRQLKGKDIDFDDLSDPDLFGKAYQKFCNIDATDVELFDFVGAIDWADSVIRATNVTKKSGWLKKNNYSFHRGDSFMNAIYTQFSVLKKDENIRIANDKWNPSDIWASSINSVPQFPNLTEYNEWIAKVLKKGTLVGISLKKTGKSPKVVHQGPTDKVELVRFGGVKSPKNFLPTGVTLIAKPAKKGGVQFRSFRISNRADITGEIVIPGSAARHGKVPASVLRDVVKQYGIPQIDKNRIAKLTDSQLIHMTQNLWKQCKISVSDKQMAQAWESRKSNIQDHVGYWQSILHAQEIGAFMSSNKGPADDIMNTFWVGAKSTGGMSSEFIKVY